MTEDTTVSSSFGSSEVSIDRSSWINDFIDKNKDMTVMREKLLPLVSGISFNNVNFADSIQDISVTHRHEILNLISQHLRLIGLHNTADTLSQESMHQFFKPASNNWETSDLRVIISLSLRLRESPWDEPNELNHEFVKEEHEEDYSASQYREDPSKIWEEYFDPIVNTVYSSTTRDYSSLDLSTLRRVVVLITSTKGACITDDELYSFFLSLHYLTTSQHFFEHLIHLFFAKGFRNNGEEVVVDNVQLLRINIINLIKKWLFFHGLFIGKRTLREIGLFLKYILYETDQFAYLKNIALPIYNVLPLLTYGLRQGSSTLKKDPPMIPDPAVILRLDLKLFDPSPIEVARQITLVAHDFFCAIHSLELITAFSKKDYILSTPTLNQFVHFNERIALLVLDTIAYSDEPSQTYNRAIDVCIKLLEMGNFGSLASIVAALQRADIQELASVSQETKKKVESLDIGHDRYKEMILDYYYSWNKTIPDLIFEIEEQLRNMNPKIQQFKSGLINWEYVKKLSERAYIMYRFQNVKYNFYPISQIQKVVINGALHDIREIEMEIDSRTKERSQQKSGDSGIFHMFRN